MTCRFDCRKFYSTASQPLNFNWKVKPMSDFRNYSDDELILEWENARKELAGLKEYEGELREAVIARKFNSVPDSGTVNSELGKGWKLKATFKQYYRLPSKGDAVEKALQAIERRGTEGKYIAERLVSWKPELVVKEYKNLDESLRKHIDKVLTISNGKASLELIPPKSK